MSNLNSLPDLSTVDIQAIADSGPVHPRISLPPLTTIAENWDTLVHNTETGNTLVGNEVSFSEEDDEDSEEEEEEHKSSSVKIQDSKSLRASCSSSSSSSGQDSDSSDSELSSSDSADSSSSSSDSDTDSPSSVSSSSCKSKPHPSATKSSNIKDHQSFSVREANYDKGRVTLRLSSLQIEKKPQHHANFNEYNQPYITGNGILRTDKLGPSPNSAFNAVVKSSSAVVKKHESPTRPIAKPSVSIIKVF